jgi:hypothetical protein
MPHWVRRVAGEYLEVEVYQNILKDMRRKRCETIYTRDKTTTSDCYAILDLLHRAITKMNSIPHQVTDASSRIRCKKNIY